ncbi:helix-turn-helix domain-containing protein [uncultured Flavonifractor sp.]|uniref:Helix-turn-helix domain-containing protein n=1 Tax=Candidatus Flavonifractor intestinigallinarum TaxID=2838586 RepID=A0A9D2MKE7_9FIRM|nr:helix-turn-helix transcriptional regulator [uncultured Flavonifractor sp.]HJB80036.1 helix-turn-helix domain-containing protein [Candidatus Flavonifractor intestinigallinarum]
MEKQEKKRWLGEVGTRVWNCRAQLDMSREQLAERLGITAQYVSDIEQGKKCMSMSIFVEMSQVLGVGLDYLAHGVPPEDPALDRLERHLRQVSPLDRELAARMLQLALEAAQAMGPEA